MRADFFYVIVAFAVTVDDAVSVAVAVVVTLAVAVKSGGEHGRSNR